MAEVGRPAMELGDIRSRRGVGSGWKTRRPWRMRTRPARRKSSRLSMTSPMARRAGGGHPPRARCMLRDAEARRNGTRL